MNLPLFSVQKTIVVPASHSSLVGHFPGSPVVPGVVLLAEIEQLILEARPKWRVRSLPMVKFSRLVLPDQPVEVIVRFYDLGPGKQYKAQFELMDDQQAISASGQLILDCR